jgi:hypothetical protein
MVDELFLRKYLPEGLLESLPPVQSSAGTALFSLRRRCR